MCVFCTNVIFKKLYYFFPRSIFIYIKQRFSKILLFKIKIKNKDKID